MKGAKILLAMMILLGVAHCGAEQEIVDSVLNNFKKHLGYDDKADKVYKTPTEKDMSDPIYVSAKEEADKSGNTDFKSFYFEMPKEFYTKDGANKLDDDTEPKIFWVFVSKPAPTKPSQAKKEEAQINTITEESKTPQTKDQKETAETIVNKDGGETGSKEDVKNEFEDLIKNLSPPNDIKQIPEQKLKDMRAKLEECTKDDKDKQEAAKDVFKSIDQTLNSNTGNTDQTVNPLKKSDLFKPDSPSAQKYEISTCSYLDLQTPVIEECQKFRIGEPKDNLPVDGKQKCDIIDACYSNDVQKFYTGLGTAISEETEQNPFNVPDALLEQFVQLKKETEQIPENSRTKIQTFVNGVNLETLTNADKNSIDKKEYAAKILEEFTTFKNTQDQLRKLALDHMNKSAKIDRSLVGPQKSSTQLEFTFSNGVANGKIKVNSGFGDNKLLDPFIARASFDYLLKVDQSVLSLSTIEPMITYIVTQISSIFVPEKKVFDLKGELFTYKLGYFKKGQDMNHKEIPDDDKYAGAKKEIEAEITKTIKVKNPELELGKDGFEYLAYVIKAEIIGDKNENNGIDYSSYIDDFYVIVTLVEKKIVVKVMSKHFLDTVEISVNSRTVIFETVYNMCFKVIEETFRGFAEIEGNDANCDKPIEYMNTKLNEIGFEIEGEKKPEKKEEIEETEEEKQKKKDAEEGAKQITEKVGGDKTEQEIKEDKEQKEKEEAAKRKKKEEDEAAEVERKKLEQKGQTETEDISKLPVEEQKAILKNKIDTLPKQIEDETDETTKTSLQSQLDEAKTQLAALEITVTRQPGDKDIKTEELEVKQPVVKPEDLAGQNTQVTEDISKLPVEEQKAILKNKIDTLPKQIEDETDETTKTSLQSQLDEAKTQLAALEITVTRQPGDKDIKTEELEVKQPVVKPEDLAGQNTQVTEDISKLPVEEQKAILKNKIDTLPKQIEDETDETTKTSLQSQLDEAKTQLAALEITVTRQPGDKDIKTEELEVKQPVVKPEDLAGQNTQVTEDISKLPVEEQKAILKNKIDTLPKQIEDETDETTKTSLQSQLDEAKTQLAALEITVTRQPGDKDIKTEELEVKQPVVKPEDLAGQNTQVTEDISKLPVEEQKAILKNKIDTLPKQIEDETDETTKTSLQSQLDEAKTQLAALEITVTRQPGDKDIKTEELEVKQPVVKPEDLAGQNTQVTEDISKLPVEEQKAILKNKIDTLPKQIEDETDETTKTSLQSQLDEAKTQLAALEITVTRQPGDKDIKTEELEVKQPVVKPEDLAGQNTQVTEDISKLPVEEQKAILKNKIDTLPKQIEDETDETTKTSLQSQLDEAKTQLAALEITVTRQPGDKDIKTEELEVKQPVVKPEDLAGQNTQVTEDISKLPVEEQKAILKNKIDTLPKQIEDETDETTKTSLQSQLDEAKTQLAALEITVTRQPGDKDIKTEELEVKQPVVKPEDLAGQNTQVTEDISKLPVEEQKAILKNKIDTLPKQIEDETDETTKTSLQSQLDEAKTQLAALEITVTRQPGDKDIKTEELEVKQPVVKPEDLAGQNTQVTEDISKLPVEEQKAILKNKIDTLPKQIEDETDETTKTSLQSQLDEAKTQLAALEITVTRQPGDKDIKTEELEVKQPVVKPEDLAGQNTQVTEDISKLPVEEQKAILKNKIDTLPKQIEDETDETTKTSLQSQLDEAKTQLAALEITVTRQPGDKDIKTEELEVKQPVVKPEDLAGQNTQVTEDISKLPVEEQKAILKNKIDTLPKQIEDETDETTKTSLQSQLDEAKTQLAALEITVTRQPGDKDINNSPKKPITDSFATTNLKDEIQRLNNDLLNETDPDKKAAIQKKIDDTTAELPKFGTVHIRNLLDQSKSLFLTQVDDGLDSAINHENSLYSGFYLSKNHDNLFAIPNSSPSLPNKNSNRFNIKQTDPIKLVKSSNKSYGTARVTSRKLAQTATLSKIIGSKFKIDVTHESKDSGDVLLSVQLKKTTDNKEVIAHKQAYFPLLSQYCMGPFLFSFVQKVKQEFAELIYSICIRNPKDYNEEDQQAAKNEMGLRYSTPFIPKVKYSDNFQLDLFSTIDTNNPISKCEELEKAIAESAASKEKKPSKLTLQLCQATAPQSVAQGYSKNIQFLKIGFALKA
jgi:hypothetical protein